MCRLFWGSTTRAGWYQLFGTRTTVLVVLLLVTLVLIVLIEVATRSIPPHHGFGSLELLFNETLKHDTRTLKMQTLRVSTKSGAESSEYSVSSTTISTVPTISFPTPLRTSLTAVPLAPKISQFLSVDKFSSAISSSSRTPQSSTSQSTTTPIASSVLPSLVPSSIISLLPLIDISLSTSQWPLSMSLSSIGPSSSTAAANNGIISPPGSDLSSESTQFTTSLSSTLSSTFVFAPSSMKTRVPNTGFLAPGDGSLSTPSSLHPYSTVPQPVEVPAASNQMLHSL